MDGSGQGSRVGGEKLGLIHLELRVRGERLVLIHLEMTADIELRVRSEWLGLTYL